MPATPLLPDRPVEDLDDHLARGGGRGLARALDLGPGGTVQELTLARLRGRGGAGFRTGTKWRSVLDGEAPRYVVANGAEGEPGTFKDRTLLRLDPYRVLEGLAIAARTLSAEEAVVALKASFDVERERVLTALTEVSAAGWFGDIAVRVVGGPEEYLFGEEKALLEVVEGHDPLPRWLPPYLHGLYVTDVQLGWTSLDPGTAAPAAGADVPGAHPTLVNNVETLANVPGILAEGPEAFRSVGTERSPGTVLVTLTGDVTRPGVVEVPLGTPLAEVVAACGGATAPVGTVLPGTSVAPLGPEALELPLTYEALAEAGSGLGSAGFVLYGEATCPLAVARMVSRFLAVESCGQCPPCKMGTASITDLLDDLLAGRADDGTVDDLADALARVTDGNRCSLPVGERTVVGGVLRRFPDVVVDHLEGTCQRSHDVAVPKIVDIGDDGTVVLDERQSRKQPDWTYAPG